MSFILIIYSQIMSNSLQTSNKITYTRENTI